MSGKGLTLGVFLTLVGFAALASAQSTTGTISGRVIDSQDRATPGVVVSATLRICKASKAPRRPRPATTS